LGTCHWFNSAGSNNANYGLQTTVANSTSEFHVYSLVWTPTYIKILVDDIEFYQLELNSSMPFKADQFLILNIAMGGNLGGTIDPNFVSSTLEIDYVRVYQ
jgi:beta-glucanase (GH16 family)